MSASAAACTLRSARAPPWLARCASASSATRPPIATPVVLRHSRIYILPTRRGLALIATLAMMLLTSLNYALSLGLVVTFLLAGLVAAALLHTFRNLAGIEITPLAAGETFAGEPHRVHARAARRRRRARIEIALSRARHARRRRRRAPARR